MKNLSKELIVNLVDKMEIFEDKKINIKVIFNVDTRTNVWYNDYDKTLNLKRLNMKNSQMHLINKMFNNDTIRTVWNKEEEKYYISVVDVVGVISESKDGRKYWNKLKQRLKDEGNETVTNCHQLKLKAQDGKYRMTDVVDIEVVLC